MKFQYLGTAAAEGIPAIFCQCEICEKSKKAGGKNIRTRSQAIINDDLLIDFNSDSYMHFLNNNIDTAKIKYCLITHTHPDHLYPNDLNMKIPGFAHLKENFPLALYGSEIVGKVIEDELKIAVEQNAVSFTQVKESEPFLAGGYKITPLKAIHDPKSGPLIYMIESQGKTILYAHDTGLFHESVWEYFKKVSPKFDFVSLDCTQAADEVMGYDTHMKLNDNLKIKAKMLELGYANESTIFVSNHFSHNGKSADYDTFKEIAEKHGVLTSYDGMTLEI